MSPTELKKLSLQTAAGGAAPELFDHLLEEILKNIRDPNTGLEKRKLVMTFEFEPIERQSDGGRGEMTVSCSAVAKLAGVKPATSFAFIARDGDGYTATTNDVRQTELLDDKTGEVTPITGRTARAN